MALNYLLDPMFQIENTAGKPATEGWLEVYLHDTRTKYYCASDFNGTLHPFKIPLDSLGSNIVLAEDYQSYDVYAYNRFGSLLMSRYNVQPGSGGGSGLIITGEMQHWLGMYGPTYTPFPGDNAGHTLGISKWEIDYDGDFIDRIETCPYPDGTTPNGYIYLKPGLYFVSCIIRYQQADDALSNTLDEVLMYTGAGNANESLAYQMDSSGPEATGNRHNVRVQFIRKVPDNVSSSVLYFAPGTPVNWKEAYIQKLEIVKLDSMIYGKAGIPKVTHDDTMTGDGTPDSPLSIQDALDGKQDTLTPGDGITIDSDGNISSETYSEGWGIDIDVNNVISVDPDVIQQKLTPGEGINIDSDGNISANEYTEGWGIDIDENNVISVDPDIVQQKLTPGEGINIDSDGNISSEVYTEGWGINIDENNVISVDPDIIQQKLTPGDGIQIDSDGTITAEGEKYYEGWGILIDSDNEISVDPDIIQKKITTGEGLTLDSDGNLNLDLPPVIPLVAGDGVTLTDSDGELIISAEGRQYTAGEGITIDSNNEISVDTSVVQEKLTAGQNIEIDSDGVISAADAPTYTAGNGINIDGNNEISVDTSVVQEKLTAGQNIEIDSDGTISAELPQEEMVQFEEFDPSDYQTKLTAGQNIEIDSDGVISADVPTQEQADWDEESSTDPSYIRNKPDLSNYQEKLTAGDNITIDSDGVISAADAPTYTAGNGIDITNDVISVDTNVVQEKLTAGQNINIDSDGVISAAGGESNVFIAEVGSTTYDDIKTAVDAGKVVIARWNRIQMGIVSDWTSLWNDPTYLFGVMQDQHQGGYPKRILYRCRKLSDNTTEWVRMQEDEIALQANVNTALNAKQDKLTAGDNITIDSDGVISAADAPTYTAGQGIDITNDEISVDLTVVQKKLTAGSGVSIDSDGTISAEGETYTAGNGISIDGNNEISVDTTVVQEKLTAGQNIEIDSDGTISAELPSEEEVQFEELDPSAYATKAEVTQGLAAKQDTLTAGQNISITSDGVISATSEPCLWFLDSDGKITPKDGKHFEVYGNPAYSQVGQYYFKKAAKVQSNDSGFEIDGLLASHTGSDTQYGNYGTVAKVYTEFAQDPYMGARRGGLVVKSFENSSVHPESRIDMYAGNDSGYGVENYKNKTYVQAIVGSDYVRMRSDDIVRHVGNSDSHAPFVSAHQTNTAKTYVMQPTATAGVYDLVEESGGGGGGTTYTAGNGIDITNDVISVDSDSVAMKSDLPSEEEVEFEEFNPENMTLQQKNAFARVLGVDETVLWDNGTTSSATLSESLSNFERVRFYFVRGSGRQFVQEVTGPSTDNYVILYHSIAYTNGWISTYSYRYTANGTTFAPTEYLKEVACQTGTTTVTVRTTSAPTIVKVVGIRRISNS